MAKSLVESDSIPFTIWIQNFWYTHNPYRSISISTIGTYISAISLLSQWLNHLIFRNHNFLEFTRGEMYGPLDIISNIGIINNIFKNIFTFHLSGGLLGLCLGCSMLSFVEIIYHFIIIFLCRSKEIFFLTFSKSSMSLLCKK